MTAIDEDSDRERLARNYSDVADGYVELWSPLLVPVGGRLLDALSWDGVRRVVDVGTGAGALIPQIARLAPAAAIVGVDIAFGMLALAPHTRARLALMDAMRLGLRTAAFDVAVMAFALFHMPDPITALGEVRRVLQHRGALGVVTWADDPPIPASQVWDEELAATGARDPSPMPLRQHELMNTPEKLTELLTAAAFTPRRVWIERIEHQWDVGRFMALRTRFGETKRKLDTLDERTRARVVARITARLARLVAADFSYRGSAICAVAGR